MSPAMKTFTILADQRDFRKTRFTAAQAAEMAARGFRFSIFRPQTGEFALSLPYQVADDRDRGTLTYMQE
jgi:hypothetical protein